MGISTGVAVAGIWGGWLCYVKHAGLPARAARRFAGIYRLLMHLYFVDELYQFLFVRPVVKLAKLSGRFDFQGIDAGVDLTSRLTAKLSILVGWEDLRVVDGAVNGLAEVVQKCGARLRCLQTGQIQHYLYSVALGFFGLYVILLLI